MSDREKFEALMRERGEDYLYRRDAQFSTLIGEYCRRNVQEQWEVWQASRRAALEESAKACDEIASDCWSLYKGRAPYTGREPGRADPQVQGESDGADKCAEAIRALATGDAN